jgi:8-oxo-dGTP diphosphatase
MPITKLFVATKAFIRHEDKILILRESGTYADGTNSGKYDVVGGRMEMGQRFDDSLRREIREETGLEVTIGQPFFVNEWRPVVRGEEWQIVGIFFECTSATDAVTLSADHAAFEWIHPKDYASYPMIENLQPAFETYLTHKL